MPRSGSTLVGSGLTGATGRFTSLAEFRRRDSGDDSVGEQVDTFTAVATDIPCHPPVVNGPKAADGQRGGELRRSEDDVVAARWTVLCKGVPDAAVDDECHVDASRLGRVRHVESDHLDATTRVLVEDVA